MIPYEQSNILKKIAMASGKIVHNFQGETTYIIIVPKKTTAPLADVVCTIDGVTNQTRKVYAAIDLGSPISMLVEGLQNAWYFFNAYRSSDGDSLDELINTIAFNAASGSQYSTTRIEYKVNRNGTYDPGTGAIVVDPVSDQNELRDPRLLDAVYWIEERATGTLAAAEYTDRSDDGGGFDLIDRTFNDGVYYFVYIVNKMDAVPGEIILAGTNGIVILTEDDDFDPALHNGKTLIINGATSVLKLNFAALSSLADCSFKINTHRGVQKYFTIQLSPGDTVFLNGEEVNAFHFGKGETGEIAIIDNEMFILQSPDRYSKLGDEVYHEKPTKLNALLCDGVEYDEINYPGAVELMDSLPASSVVDYTQRETDVIAGSVNYGKLNYRKWARNGTGKFKTPDRRDLIIKTLKNFDNTVDADRLTQGGGGYQKDQPGAVAVTVWTGQTKWKNELENDSIGIAATHGDGGVITPTSQVNTNRVNARSIYIGSGAGSKTRTENIGSYLFICV